MPLLTVESLSVSYGLVHALQAFSCEVDPGSLTLILGANGAGKTSALRAIAGLEPKVSGRVLLNGQDITKCPPYQLARSGVAVVPEGRRIFSPMTVQENLLMGGYKNRAERSSSALERVYELFPILKERKSAPGGALSGGEQQMLAFGRALMASPTLILMDEPSMGLAPVAVTEIMRAIEQMLAEGIAILLVEQNAAMALSLAATAIVLDRGRTSLRGATDDPGFTASLTNVFFGGSPGNGDG